MTVGWPRCTRRKLMVLNILPVLGGSIFSVSSIVACSCAWIRREGALVETTGGRGAETVIDEANPPPVWTKLIKLHAESLVILRFTYEAAWGQ
jgi:hypothetical protein